jgi:hypothetical protein
MAGAKLSAMRMVCRRPSSAPLYKTEATSNLNNGIFHSCATTLAIKDFPHPYTPNKNNPFGSGKP